MTEDELREIVAEFERVGAQLKAADEQRLQKRDEGLRRAKAEGWKQVEIMRVTGLSKETVRKAWYPEVRDAVRARRKAQS
jgi:hypothetical protein